MRAVFKNLLLLAISVIVACGAAEIGLRLFRPQPLEVAYAWPDGTLRHLPSFSFKYTRGEFSNTIRFNSAGLRGKETPEREPAGVKRIVFLGDSFVEAKQVSESEVFTSLLEGMSGAPPRFSVINAGVAGTGTSEELILYEKLVRSLKPDLVVLGFYPNDVRNNVDRGLFRLENGAVIAAKAPSQPKVRFIYDVRKFFASHSHLYMLGKLASDAVGEEDPRERRERKAGDADWTGDPMEAEEVFAREPASRVAQGWELTVALLGELKRRVEVDGARFVLVVFPTRFQVDDALWAAQAARIGIDPAAFDLRLPQRVLGEWATRTQTPEIDLLDDFRAKNTANTFYFSIDAHWNPAGHRLAAEKIYDGLKDLGFLPEP